MPRSEGRIRAAIWQNEEFVALSMDAKFHFMMVLSLRAMSHAGVIHIPRSEWANLFPADEDAADRLRTARKELIGGEFFVVDDATDELMVRSFLRWEIEGAGPPGTFVAGMDAAMNIESPRLRAVALAELRRFDRSAVVKRKKGQGHKELPVYFYDLAIARLSGGPQPPRGESVPTDQPPLFEEDDGVDSDPYGPAEGRSDESDHAMQQAMKHGSDHAMPHPTVGVGMGVAVAPPQVEDLGGSARASVPARTHTGGRAREGTPTRPGAGRPGPWQRQPCGRCHDPDKPCRGCKTARETAERDTAAERITERNQHRSVVQACPWVELHDPSGWLEDPTTRDPVVKCDHTTDPRFQIARARGETA
jgi:hypothetical protein